jgi:C-5 cytosine-specific DNA methylase
VLSRFPEGTDDAPLPETWLQVDSTVTTTGKDEPGFLNRYAAVGVEEDKAEVFAHMDDNACRTLRRHHDDGVKHVRDWQIIDGDVRDYDFRSHRGKVAFVSGGPPCQPLSIGGKQRGSARTTRTTDIHSSI